MKKIVLLGAAVVSLSLFSCKKDYVCECTTTYGGSSTTGSTTYVGVSKAAAKANCVSTKEYTSGGQAITGYSQTCNLK